MFSSRTSSAKSSELVRQLLPHSILGDLTKLYYRVVSILECPKTLPTKRTVRRQLVSKYRHIWTQHTQTIHTDFTNKRLKSLLQKNKRTQKTLYTTFSRSTHQYRNLYLVQYQYKSNNSNSKSITTSITTRARVIQMAKERRKMGIDDEEAWQCRWRGNSQEEEEEKRKSIRRRREKDPKVRKIQWQTRLQTKD